MNIMMWSGPRNLSTALMYAFAARGDCAVWDEPFYAAYLAATGLDHPMRGEILASGEPDTARVAEACAASPSTGKNLFYQKHMTHHMLPGFPLGFLSAGRNAFLIRHPARVVASYAAKRENPSLDDIGFRQQAALFDRVADATGQAPPVIDSADIRANPRESLMKLCAALGISFCPAMLSWPAGPKPFDGAWAPHWYPAVHRSTGFDVAEGPLPAVPAALQDVVDRALPFYERLRTHAL
ncbi:MAG TPA: HAD family hydrolase [Paracoccaceae bacterium]|nr:HAD family hydrolase [Paracoccaceae bacterium]HMO72594.1 HAD family hydrolase [Paracoccaceae bacterium]